MHSFGDVVRWVIEDLGAMCPSAERLAHYARTPEAPDVSDVRYHVVDAGCRLCRIELESMSLSKEEIAKALSARETR